MEELQKRVQLLPDAEIIFTVLSMHSVIKESLDGRQLELKQIEAVAIGELLVRFVPDDVAQRGFDLYFGEDDSEELNDDA